jgi:hypothetical protein
MPTPDPAALPAAVAAAAGLWTSNATTVITAVVSLLGIVAIPVLFASGALRAVIGGIRKLFGRAHA